MEHLKPLNITNNPLILKQKELSDFKELGITKKYYCYNCQKQFSKIYIENSPIEPDILVYNDPASVLSGKDLQLEAAVREMLKEIDKAQ